MSKLILTAARLKVFTNTTFEGHYPVGTAAIVYANDHCEAAHILNNKLAEIGLDNNFIQPCDMVETEPTIGATILCDGNY